jgi:cell division protein FtsZ
MTTFKVDLPEHQSSIIKVIGVGGGGGNAVNYMYEKGIKGVDFFVCNTDSQVLESSPVPNKIQIGSALTEGLGAGSDPEIGRKCAMESIDMIEDALAHNTKMVFITAGMGGGTGTGAAPVIAEAAQKMGILTVGIVTTPFLNEGKQRIAQATQGIEALRPHVDALLIITNDRILQMYHNMRYTEAFAKADDVLCTAAKGIAEIITVAGQMNVDFMDVKTAMLKSGRAIMGTGISEGDDRAIQAAQMALESPLLDDTSIEGAKHILLNISFENDEPYASEIDQITSFFQNASGQKAKLKFGLTKSENLENALSVTVIATGFEKVVGEIDEEEAYMLESPDEEPGIMIFDTESETEKIEEVKSFKLDFDFKTPTSPSEKTHDATFEHGFGAKKIIHDFAEQSSVKPNPVAGGEQPAFMRRGIVLEPVVEEERMQKHFLEEKNKETSLRDNNNRFLNKDVD